MNAVARSTFARAGSSERIVYIMDDDPAVCGAIRRVLTNAGFSAREFTRVTELELALALVLPDAILLDLSLGECDAIEVIRRLAAAHFGGAILLMSGRHDPGMLEEVEKIGRQYGIVMLPFLQKPFRFDELKTRLALVTSERAVSTGGTDLENALQNNWLELWYQPKIDLKSRLVCGAEALIRLRHPDRGILPPSDFLPGSGDPLHKPLAGFVIRRALADWSSFAGHGITTRLAINMPISIFETPDFVSSLRRYLPNDAKFPGLIVELTEDEILRDPGFAREVAMQLKLYNIGIAVDDFGSGYSTLERLQELPFTELKIDRKYVNGCASDKEKHLLCQGVVAVAHRMNMAVIAEGVEVLSDVQSLTAMKCDGAQGFFFAKPMEPEEFKKTMLSRALAKGLPVRKVR